MNAPIITDPDEAWGEGFRPLTYPYVRGEYWMLVRALEQLHASEIECCMVPIEDGVEVWRRYV